MQEIFNQLLSEIRSALRFRWVGMGVAWLGCVVGWGVVAWMPDIYEANARVFVDTSSALQPLLRGQVVEQDVEAQLTAVREALLGRANMVTVVTETGLDARATTDEGYEQLLQSLALAIEVYSERTSRTSADSLYEITYRNVDRELAVSVVSALVESFEQNTVGASNAEQERTEEFLVRQVEEKARLLNESDQRVADFMRENAERLPGQQGNFFDRLNRERDELAAARRDLRIARSTREQIASQLAGETSVVAGSASGADSPPPNSLDARIRDAELELETLLLDFTERYPPVIALQERLSQLRAQREERLTALGVEGADTELSSLELDPVYQELRIRRNQADIDIATLEADIAEREAKVAELQGLIEEVPQVEAELARLTRDHDTIYNDYQELLGSLQQHRLSTEAEAADSVEFNIIDPPRALQAPVAPNRLLLLAAVFAGALGAGGALCYVLAQIRPVFGSVRNLRNIAQLPVLGVVTHAWGERRRAEIRRGMLAFALSVLGLAAVFLVLAGFEYAGPGIQSLLS